MQRREQQRRAAGGGASSYLGGGSSGYSPVPQQQRFDTPDPIPARNTSTSASSTRAPAFKGSGMKLGSKKTKQAELLDALGGEVLSTTGAATELSAPPTPTVATEQQGPKDPRGSLPVVIPERSVSLYITLLQGSYILCS